MRTVTLTPLQYETFVFPAVATATAEDVQQMDAARGVIRKLKDSTISVEAPLSEEDMSARLNGQNVYAFRKLKSAEAEFSLQEEEWGFLLAVLMKNKTKVQLLALDDYEAMVDSIAAARNGEEPT